jgi:hypothetical protein
MGHPTYILTIYSNTKISSEQKMNTIKQLYHSAGSA